MKSYSYSEARANFATVYVPVLLDIKGGKELG